MKICTTVSKKVFFTFFLLIIATFILDGCKKESATKELSNIEIIEKYKLLLFKDIDFINNFKLDRMIIKINSNNNLNSKQRNILLELINNSKNISEIKQLFESSGFQHTDELFKLFELKTKSLLNIKRKFPDLKYLTNDELKELHSYSYANLVIEINNMAIHKPGCNTNCCDTYVGSMQDCDTDFTIGTGISLVGGAIATVLGTPIAGSLTVTSGIGGAYLYYQRCSSSAANAYRQCMGYQN